MSTSAPALQPSSPPGRLWDGAQPGRRRRARPRVQQEQEGHAPCGCPPTICSCTRMRGRLGRGPAQTPRAGCLGEPRDCPAAGKPSLPRGGAPRGVGAWGLPPQPRPQGQEPLGHALAAAPAPRGACPPGRLPPGVRRIMRRDRVVVSDATAFQRFVHRVVVNGNKRSASPGRWGLRFSKSAGAQG